MRYNPPPNWPKPPEGWVPHPDWSPDPSWPPPPPGWRLWVDDGAPSAEKTKSALSRLDRTGDDVEYFGDDRAWSEDSGPPPADDRSNAAVPATSPRPTQVAPEDIAVDHLGHHATIKWNDEQKYVMGKIVAVSGDATTISVTLDGIQSPVSFSRDTGQAGAAEPSLYVWV